MIGLAIVLVLAAQIPPPSPSGPVLGPLVEDTIEAAPPVGFQEPPAVAPREVPQPQLDELRAEERFQYDRPEAEQPSFWDRFWAWFIRTFLQPVGEGITSRPTRWGLMALAGAVFLWVLVRLLRGEGSGLFGRKDLDAAEAGELLLDVEDIEAVDLDARLADVLREGDHRAAVRLRYLLALQRLSQRGHIDWARDKTNRTYVVETRQSAGSEVARAFADVTRVFDHVWYGGLGVDADRYGRFAQRFDQLDAYLAGSRSRRPVPA